MSRRYESEDEYDYRNEEYRPGDDGEMPRRARYNRDDGRGDGRGEGRGDDNHVDTNRDRYRGESDDEERRIRAKRRAERRARREEELRRQQRRMLVTIGTGIGIVVLVLILVFGVRGCAAGTDDDSPDTSVGSADADLTGTGDAESGDSGGASGDGSMSDDPAEDSGSAEDGMSDVSEAESEEESSSLSLPYYYYETEDTIDLGESLTDISIYDSQRHISSSSSDSTDSDETNVSEDGSAGAESETSTVYGDSSDETSDSSDSEDETAATDDDYIDSQYVILINADTGEILAERNAYERIIPASMTKVMTLLVAIEAMEDYETAITDTFTITQAITDESYLSGSSFVGYGVDDVATVEDLLYGTILPSGADAALALAEYTAGSKDAFVELMNAKCVELGISETTHFTNVIGLYDDGENYSTPYDMCVIMNAAIDNEYCQAILSQRTWTTQAIMNNPDGTTISNWFLRRAEDHIDNWEILCGKTGFVNESGNCAVSYMKSSVTGTNYIACTALTYSSWRCIYDHAAIYNYYTE